MMTYKPTFKPSAARRSFRQRLTPLAWVLLGVVLLLVILAILAVGMSCSARPAAWQPTPTAAPSSTVGPTAMVGPSPTATQWWEGSITATATPVSPMPAPPFPAWWSDQMTQDADGQWWPPEEVARMVEEHYNTYIESYRAALIDTTPPDYAAYEQVIHDWTSGMMLAGNETGLQQYRGGDINISGLEWDTCLFVAQPWSADGQECILGVTCQDGTYSEYDPVTGEPLSQEPLTTSGLIKFRMVYDPWSGHWKLDDWLETILPGQE